MSTITTVFNSFTDVQQYEKLENEREKTMMDPNYQKWMSELNVSRSYVQPDGFIRAKQLTSNTIFQTSPLNHHFLTFLKLKVYGKRISYYRYR